MCPNSLIISLKWYQMYVYTTKSFTCLLKGVIQLAITLNEESEDHILAATTWALGQIGRHSAEHSKAVATANVLPQLLKLYLNPESSDDLQSKVKIQFIHVCYMYIENVYQSLLYICVNT